jgi:hypothetical protein
MVAPRILDVHDEKQIHQFEEELHIEILPGTEIMTDFGTHHFVKQTGSKGPVLVPQPSNNPHDPLNWSRKRKALIIFIANFFSFMLGFAPLAIAPQFPVYIEDFNSTLPDVIQFACSSLLTNLIPDWCVHPRSRLLQFHLGAYLHELRATRCNDMEFADLFSQHDMARQSQNLWQFHGRLCAQRYRRGPRRNDATRYHVSRLAINSSRHCGCSLPSRAWIPHDVVYGLVLR